MNNMAKNNFELKALRLQICGSGKCVLPSLTSFQARAKLKSYASMKTPGVQLNSPCVLIKAQGLQRKSTQQDDSFLNRTTGGRTVKRHETPSALRCSAVLNAKKQEKYSRSTSEVPPKCTGPVKQESAQLVTDEYYYQNILKTHVSSFSELLQLNNSQMLTYLYMSKKNATPVVCKERSGAVERPSLKCRCFQPVLPKRYAVLRHFYRTVPRYQVYCEFLPRLKRVGTPSERAVKFPGKLVIFNLEGVIFEREYSAEKRYIMRPKTKKLFRKLRNFYHVVVVYSDKYNGARTFLKYIEKSDIELSGTYEVVSDHRNHNKGILDYRTIYKDFNISFPNSDVLVVSCLRLPNEIIEELDGSELIAHKHGLYTHLNVMRPPVAYREAQNIPITLLIPSLNSEEPSLSSSHIMKLLVPIQDSSFSNIFLNSNLSFIASSGVSESILEKSAQITAVKVRIMNQFDTETFCKLHTSPMCEPESLPVNHFALMKLSQFPR